MESMGRGRGQQFAGINVTPLADIMIVLLVIFMAVTTFITSGIPMVLPKAAHDDPEHPKDITVTITPTLETHLNDVLVPTAADLEGRLREAVKRLPDGRKLVYLKADKGLPYEEVGKVLTLCRSAGADEIALLTDPKR